jgi:hypothetical protein
MHQQNKGWMATIPPDQGDKIHLGVRAAEDGARFVTIGPLVFFSTQNGDAWMLSACKLITQNEQATIWPTFIAFGL